MGSRVICFGDCVYDRQARELRRGGQPVTVTPRAFDLLGVLLEARPRALSKNELRDHLWPDNAVGDTSLAKLVTELRQTLGDSPRKPRLVRTVHRFGYAFCSEVQEETGAPPSGTPSGCSILIGDREIRLHTGDNGVGRAPDSVVRVTSWEASRQHARIVVTDGAAVLEDLASKNGTRLNDQRLQAPAPLAHGDRIVIGRLELTFVASTGTTRTTPRL